MVLNRNLAKVKSRTGSVAQEVHEAVQKILRDVRENGDRALAHYARQFDGFTGQIPTVLNEAEIQAAFQAAGEDFLKIAKRAKAQITQFHANQVEQSWDMGKAHGVVMGQIVRPLERVAIYVPGGTAAYPSTVLMCAVPAILAGVENLVIFTPVKADGRISPEILAAAALCGIRGIYKVGGAQAIGAAAYGTETIPKVDKIVGPGNAYVAEAKRLVYGEVDIDMVAGPSEILIIADEKANPRYIAADLLGQAEHDSLARAILVTTSEKIIAETELELQRQLETLSRREIAEKSLSQHGAAILAKNLDEAFAIANDLAPEHLEILTENPLDMLPKVKHAGSIFLGEYTPEALGDYMSGTNHVLPTAGTARFYSPLSVRDFVKWSSYSYYPREALAAYKDDVMQFARLEGFDAHANSVAVRFEEA